MRTRAASICLGVMLAVAAAVPALEVPYLTGRVNDYAGMLDPEEESRVAARLEALEQANGAQVVVLTIPSLEGEVLEDYSLRVAETWGLGNEEVDNGLLFLIARDDRKLRLEVGYGLEGVIPDVLAGRILRNVVQPEFRAGRFAAGIEAAVETIATAIEGGDVSSLAQSSDSEEIPWPARLVMGGIFFLVVGTFSLIALASSGGVSWFLFLFLLPFWSSFPLAFAGVPVGCVFPLVWLVGFPIAKLLIAKSDWGKRWAKKLKPMVMTSGRKGRSGGWTLGGGGGFSGGGFSGGGFSGGGGSFGGGGSSGGW